MNNILTDDKTGQQYMLSPSSQELERGIIQYVPDLHAHLWSYIMLDGQLYSIHPYLIDWDQGVEEWKKDIKDDIFKDLLGNSTKEVEIFWICLDLANKVDSGMYCIVMMKENPICWRFHHF